MQHSPNFLVIFHDQSLCLWDKKTDGNSLKNTLGHFQQVVFKGKNEYDIFCKPFILLVLLFSTNLYHQCQASFSECIYYNNCFSQKRTHPFSDFSEYRQSMRGYQ